MFFPNTFISLQKGFLSLMSVALLFSCSHVEHFDTLDLVESQERLSVSFDRTFSGENLRTSHCEIGEVNLNVGNGRYFDIGKVTVYKQGHPLDTLFITVSINRDAQDWFILKSHLFVGSISSLSKRNPAPGQFKNSEETVLDNGRGDKEQTYKFKLRDFEDLRGKLDFALHADLVKAVPNGDNTYSPIEYEGAWGDGVRFNDNGSWSRYFQFNVNVDCDD